MSLRLDWATFEAAKYACENWHYSKCMPIGKTTKVGVWEDNQYIGVIIFSHGTAKDLGTKYGFSQFQCCELTRVALKNGHKCQVSRALAIALRFLQKISPGLKLVVSFADADRGHHGGIYQAGNWIYAGRVSESVKYIFNGKELTSRVVHEIYKTDRSFKSKCTIIPRKPKYRYLYALDCKTKQSILHLSLPYPKRAGSKDTVVFIDQIKEGGETPTPALQTKDTSCI